MENISILKDTLYISLSINYKVSLIVSISK